MDYFAAGELGAGEKTHHLLRHSLPQEERGEGVLMHFETDSVAEACRTIKKLSQRDLQAKFKAIYGAKTHSNNNNWLRRKLFEAIGVDPAKGAGKKPAGAIQKRRKAPNKGAGAGAGRVAPKASVAAAALHEMDQYAAEALLALGEVASGLMSEESAPSASTGASSEAAAAPTLTGDGEDVSGQGWFESPGADREVPGNTSAKASSRQQEPSPFATAPQPQPLACASPSPGRSLTSSEEEGETTEGAPASLFVGAPGSRANSSTLPFLPAFEAADLSCMATNVGQLYAWLLARQQQQHLAAAAAAPFMPPGYTGHPHSHPLAHHALPVPMAGFPMMGGLLPGALPVAPPLFSGGKAN